MAKPPSSSLLAILAILATASGSPTPLPFLCPSSSHYGRHFPRSQPTTTPVPVKFIQCSDGLWRRAEFYELYGSTFCGSSLCTSTQAASTSGYPSPTPTDNSDDIRDSLPPGWNPVPTANGSTTLIVILAPILAFTIFIVISGYVFFWKKRRRRDREAGAGCKPSAEGGRTKPKIWQLAWKPNLRHVRQRKGKRVVTASSRSQISLPSRTSSQRSSVVSLSDDLSEDESPTPTSLSAISTPTISPIATLPPAYHHEGQELPVIYSNISHANSHDRQSSSFAVNSSTPNSLRAAHVATDDKTLLARLVDSTSRPPEETSTDTLDACDTLVSAPAWHDELEEIPPDLIISNDHPPICPASSLFPPLPSKEHIFTGDLYDYSFSFEGTGALEPEPSAPPFHLDSAPPSLDDHQIVPSAPPLLDDTEFLVDVHPSAPQLDMGDENPAGQDHDRMSSTSGLPSSDIPSSSTSRRDVGVRDDITLPGYRP